MSLKVDNHASITVRTLLQRYRATRSFTAKLCETLGPEDCCLQSMVSASPVRWHLAHTSWFFETFLLKHDPDYQVFDPHYEVLFNSYYNAVGQQFPRAQRGLLSRPTLEETFAYRHYIDQAVEQRLEAGWEPQTADLAQIMELGIQHEQQHQELILTDVKHLFSLNPLFPKYREGQELPTHQREQTAGWLSCDEGVYEVGHEGESFAFDNEGPRHRVLLESHCLASRPVTNGEFLEFIIDGGYSRAELWLSLGWDQVQQDTWAHPLYWFNSEGQWQEFTLAGLRALDLQAPVTHISFFEADAFARWAGARLPTESEWEVHAENLPIEGNFADLLLRDNYLLHPSSCALTADQPLGQATKMFGDVWEWTASPYTAYPGYQPVAGALGEYNGKFMCNQYVLRGGSVATSVSHIRLTYRNFFPPETRWQFSGCRLAK